MNYEELTPRELEVLALLEQGMSTNEIAAHFVITPATVRNHIQSVMTKLGAHSRVEAIARARGNRAQPPGEKVLRLLTREGYRLTDRQKDMIREAFSLPSPPSPPKIPQQPDQPAAEVRTFTVSWTGTR